MPRLSGVVSENLFAAVDAWREAEHARSGGAKWTRQAAIEYLTLVGLRALWEESKGYVAEALREVNVQWDVYDVPGEE